MTTGRVVLPDSVGKQSSFIMAKIEERLRYCRSANIAAAAPDNIPRPAGASLPSAKCVRILFDYFVGAGEQRRRHIEAHGSRSLEVDDQLELGRHLYCIQVVSWARQND
jgi:hypothetical protein